MAAVAAIALFVATGSASVPIASALPPGTPASSCNGTDACLNAAGPIGDNSCNGDFACENASEPIGDGSCNGERACEDATSSVGDNSCVGEIACQLLAADVADDSCHGQAACQFPEGEIGEGSCNGDIACQSSKDVGDESCNGFQACEFSDAPVGDGSCNGADACQFATQPVGDGSCNGDGACELNDGEVGNGSCNGEDTCRNNDDTVGDFSCNGDGNCSDAGVVGDCEQNDDPCGILIVTKFLWPLHDKGRFNLWVDGEKEASNVGGGGTTGKLGVEPGEHVVKETGSGLSNYFSSITCRDTDDGGAVVASRIGPGPLTVDVAESDEITCIVRNIRRPGR